jgi:hypothetical protein
MIWYAYSVDEDLDRGLEIRTRYSRYSINGESIADWKMGADERVVIDRSDKSGHGDTVVAHVTSHEAALAVCRLLLGDPADPPTQGINVYRFTGSFASLASRLPRRDDQGTVAR